MANCPSTSDLQPKETFGLAGRIITLTAISKPLKLRRGESKQIGSLPFQRWMSMKGMQDARYGIM